MPYPISLAGTDDLASCTAKAPLTRRVAAWSFGPVTDGAVSFWYWSNSPGPGACELATSSQLATGRWYHLAFVNNGGVYDGSSNGGADTLKIFKLICSLLDYQLISKKMKALNISASKDGHDYFTNSMKAKMQYI